MRFPHSSIEYYLLNFLRVMLEGKHCRAFDFVFSFGFGYSETWLGLQDDNTLIHVHVPYTPIVIQLLSHNYSISWSTKDMDEMRPYVK